MFVGSGRDCILDESATEVEVGSGEVGVLVSTDVGNTEVSDEVAWPQEKVAALGKWREKRNE